MYDFMWGEAFPYKVEQFPHRLVQWSTIEKQGYKSREKIIICKIWIVSCKDDTTVLKSLTYFIKKSIHRRIHSKT
jgi:hypothetical protein